MLEWIGQPVLESAHLFGWGYCKKDSRSPKTICDHHAFTASARPQLAGDTLHSFGQDSFDQDSLPKALQIVSVAFVR